MDEILIEERIIGTRVADLTMKLWGSEFTLPIMMPAFSHLNKAGLDHRSMEEYRTAYRIGGIYSCLLLWFSHGMTETPEEMTRIAASM